MADIRPLTEKQLPESGYLFKHSTRCPVSSSAARDVRDAQFDLPVFWVNVIEQREISDYIAATLGVRHESPQLIELRNGKVISVWNHGDIYDHLHG